MLSPEAASVYRTALESVPDSREFDAVIAHLDPVCSPSGRAGQRWAAAGGRQRDRVPALAADLAALWESLGDDQGVRRAWRPASAAVPATVIHDRLEQHYRDRGLWQPLAGMMVDDADHLADGRPSGRPACARPRRPPRPSVAPRGGRGAGARPTGASDDHLLADLVASLVAAARPGQAIDALTGALAGGFCPAPLGQPAAHPQRPIRRRRHRRGHDRPGGAYGSTAPRRGRS
jgi:hypothetical protein